MEDFCIEHVNKLGKEAREEIFTLIMIHVKNIDSSNSDGSRVFVDEIPRAVLEKIYEIIKFYMQ